MAERYLIIQCAALGHDFLKETRSTRLAGLDFKPAQSLFPALTCPVQAGFRTGAPASSHGMVFNGHYSRSLMRPSFWEQSSRLVSGPRIWEGYQARGGRVGVFFWQQSLGEKADIILSPWPVHKHGGGLVDVTYARPAGLYEKLCGQLNSRFRLLSYWGPLAGVGSSRWIARATARVMAMPDAPGVLFTYLPHLDYALQKYPAQDKRCAKSLEELETLLSLLVNAADRFGYEVLVFGDYAIGPAKKVVYPNRILRRAGLMEIRDVKGRLYPDYYCSDAFCVADHEIAHVFLKDGSRAREAARVFEKTGELEAIHGDGLKKLGMDHPQSGEVLLLGKPGTWFAYPWWTDEKKAPDFSGHIDIHNKPGYDPCELFMSMNPFKVTSDTSRVKGTHGNAGPERLVAWASTFDMGGELQDLRRISLALEEKLDALTP